MTTIKQNSPLPIKIIREMHQEFHPKHTGLIHPDCLVMVSTYGPVNGHGKNIIPKKVAFEIHIVPLPWDRETEQEIHADSLVEDIIFEETENLFTQSRAYDTRAFIVWPKKYQQEIVCPERVND